MSFVFTKDKSKTLGLLYCAGNAKSCLHSTWASYLVSKSHKPWQQLVRLIARCFALLCLRVWLSPSALVCDSNVSLPHYCRACIHTLNSKWSPLKTAHMCFQSLLLQSSIMWQPHVNTHMYIYMPCCCTCACKHAHSTHVASMLLLPLDGQLGTLSSDGLAVAAECVRWWNLDPRHVVADLQRLWNTCHNQASNLAFSIHQLVQMIFATFRSCYWQMPQDIRAHPVFMKGSRLYWHNTLESAWRSKLDRFWYLTADLPHAMPLVKHSGQFGNRERSWKR